MPPVTVYNYKCYDIHTDTEVIKPHMATLEVIERTNKCVALMDTAKIVEASEVDAEGRYYK